MENNLDNKEELYLENFWKRQQVVIGDSVRVEINELILLSFNKRILESNQVRNAEAQGINFIIPFPDSRKIENWIKGFLIQYDNLTKDEFKHWLLQERNRIIEKATKVNKYSHYHHILKVIKALLNKSEEYLGNNMKKQLLEYFKKGEVDACFSRLEDYHISSSEIIQLQSRWNTLKKLKMMGEIDALPSPEENQIKASLLNLIQEIE